MRILLCGGNHRAEIRGAAVAIHGLAYALRDRGHDVTLLHAALPAHQRRLEGIRCVYTGVVRKSVYPLIFALRSLRDYDVVHANDESGAYLALRQQLQHFPLVVQFQPPRVRTESFWNSHWRWRYIGIAAPRAPLLLTPSQWLAEAMAQRYRIPAGRFRAIPYGIGAPWFDAYRGPARAAKRRLRVVLVNMKGVDVALRAFAKAAAGLDAALELYGVDKSEQEHRRLAAELGLQERVRFEGFVPNAELPRRIADADLLLHPTRSESFGQVLGEAAALGLPAVSTRVNAVPEVVADGETGLLCPLDDVDAFAGALASLLRERDLRLRMGEAARRRAEQLWRWERVAARVEDEVYAPLIAERGRPPRDSGREPARREVA